MGGTGKPTLNGCSVSLSTPKGTPDRFGLSGRKKKGSAARRYRCGWRRTLDASPGQAGPAAAHALHYGDRTNRE